MQQYPSNSTSYLTSSSAWFFQSAGDWEHYTLASLLDTTLVPTYNHMWHAMSRVSGHTPRRTIRPNPCVLCSRALQTLPSSPGGALWRSSGLCRLAGRRHGLSRRQQRLCRRHRHLMPHLHAAALHSVDTCQHVFQWHRWNCSSVQLAPRFVRDLQAGQ